MRIEPYLSELASVYNSTGRSGSKMTKTGSDVKIIIISLRISSYFVIHLISPLC